MNNGQDSSTEQGQPQPASGQPAPTGAEQPLSGLEAAKAYMAVHGVPWDTVMHVVYAGAAILIAGAVVGVMSWQRGRAADRIGIPSKLMAEAASPSALTEVLDRNATPALKPAVLLRLAQAQYSEGNYALALSTYEQFTKAYPTHQLVPIAEMGRIVCRESQGMVSDALREYGEFIKTHPQDVMAEEAVFGRGRCMEQMGDFAGAKQVYDDFIVEYPQSVWLGRARQSAENARIKMERAARMTPPSAPAAEVK